MPDTASSHEAMMTTETLNENISWTKKFFTTVSNSVGSEFGVILLILLVTTSICLQVSFCHIRTIICSISVIYSSCNVQQILQLILCVYISGAKIQQDCSSNRKSAPTMDTLYSNIATIVTVLLGIAIPTIKLSINRPRSSWTFSRREFSSTSFNLLLYEYNSKINTSKEMWLFNMIFKLYNKQYAPSVGC